MGNQLRFTRDELLTREDVAEILRVRRTTALDYMRRGVIPARKIGKLWYSPLLPARAARAVARG